MLVLTGGSESDEPDVAAFESLAKSALERADSDGSGQVTFDEFVEWARSNVAVMGAVEQLGRVTGIVKVNMEDEDSAEEEVSPATHAITDQGKADMALTPQILLQLSLCSTPPPPTRRTTCSPQAPRASKARSSQLIATRSGRPSIQAGATS